MTTLLTILGVAFFVGLICLIFYLQPRKDMTSNVFDLNLVDIWEPEKTEAPKAPVKPEPTPVVKTESPSSPPNKPRSSTRTTITRPVQKRDYAPDSSYRSSSSLNSGGWSTWSSSDYGSSSSSSDSCSFGDGGGGGGGGCD